MADETKTMEQSENKPAPADMSTNSNMPKKKGNKALIIIIVVVLLLCLCLGLAGAGVYYFTNRSANDILNQLQDSVSNAQQDQNSSGDNMTNDNNSTSDNNVSFGTNLPDGFPSDVPVYTGASVSGSSVSNGEIDVVLSANAKSSDIYQFYKSELATNGWTITTDSNYLSTYSIQAQKDSKTLTVGISDGVDNGNTTSVITLVYN